jgi:2-hydroxy-3-oxopropionate reductase
VSGGEPKAIDGTLAIMVGGKEAVFHQVKDVLLKMGSSAVLCGDIGAGNVTKLANQIVVALNIAAMSEAFVLATKAGVDPSEGLRRNQGRARRQHGAQRQGADGARRQLQARIQNRAAHQGSAERARYRPRVGVPLPLTSQIMEILQALKVDGHQKDDHSGIIQFYEKMAGIKVRKP